VCATIERGGDVREGGGGGGGGGREKVRVFVCACVREHVVSMYIYMVG